MAAFPADMEISIQVALIYETIGRFADALSLLTDLSGNQSSYSYAIRARLHHRVGQRDRAAEDLRRMLQAPSVEVASLLEALSIAPQVAPDIFVGLADSPALLSLAPAQRVFVALQLDDGEEELPAKAAILESALDNESEPDPIVAHQLALVSIGIRRFERAVLLLEPKPGKPRKLEIADTFNLAMAKLGLTGVPERHLFETVVNLETGRSKTDNSANYAFCLAIANAAIGHNAEAREWLELSRATISAHPRREFSPWTYAKVPAAKFKQQLSELEHQMNLGVLTPAFSNGQQDLLA
jgi:tetratricopeptide (TPR) repeat protein